MTKNCSFMNSKLFNTVNYGHRFDGEIVLIKI